MTNYTEQRARRKELNHRRQVAVVGRLVFFFLLGMGWVALGLPGGVFWSLVIAFYVVLWSVKLVARYRHVFRRFGR